MLVSFLFVNSSPNLGMLAWLNHTKSGSQNLLFKQGSANTAPSGLFLISYHTFYIPSLSELRIPGTDRKMDQKNRLSFHVSDTNYLIMLSSAV